MPKTHVSTRWVLRIALHIEQDVRVPSEELLGEYSDERVERSIFEDLVVVGETRDVLRREAKLGACARHEVLVTFHGHGSLMVRTVRRTPCMVRTQNELNISRVSSVNEIAARNVLYGEKNRQWH